MICTLIVGGQAHRTLFEAGMPLHQCSDPMTDELPLHWTRVRIHRRPDDAVCKGVCLLVLDDKTLSQAPFEGCLQIVARHPGELPEQSVRRLATIRREDLENRPDGLRSSVYAKAHALLDWPWDRRVRMPAKQLEVLSSADDIEGNTARVTQGWSGPWIERLPLLHDRRGGQQVGRFSG